MGTTTKASLNPVRPPSALQHLQCRIADALHWIGNGALQTFKTVLFRPCPTVPKRILLFRTGSFGDSICALPAITAISKHFPDTPIDLLTNAGHPGQALVSLDQLIKPGVFQQVINYQGRSKRLLLADLRRKKYDSVIQLPQYSAPWYRLLRDMLVFRFGCGIRAGFGWQWDAAPVFRQALEACRTAPEERSRLLAILEKNGIPPGNQPGFPLNLREQDCQFVEKRLQPVFAAGKPLIALVPGAKRPQNRWPAASFGAVCRNFAERFSLVLLGGPDDRPLASEIQREHPEVFSFCGLLSPMQNASVLKQCRLVLSNDTGLMHLAYAVETPLVALFSARDLPGRWYPPERPSIRVLRRFGLPCSTCLSETCADNICMKTIEAEYVIGVMEELLRS